MRVDMNHLGRLVFLVWVVDTVRPSSNWHQAQGKKRSNLITSSLNVHPNKKHANSHDMPTCPYCWPTPHLGRNLVGNMGTMTWGVHPATQSFILKYKSIAEEHLSCISMDGISFCWSLCTWKPRVINCESSESFRPRYKVMNIMLCNHSYGAKIIYWFPSQYS